MQTNSLRNFKFINKTRKLKIYVNFGYLFTLTGVFNLILLSISICCFILILLDVSKPIGYLFEKQRDMYLILICCSYMYSLSLIVINAIFWKESISLELSFHFVG